MLTEPSPLAAQLTLALHKQLLISYGTTECHCVQAGRSLTWLLNLVDVASTFIAGTWSDDQGDDPHCWVEIDDWIYDPTADQFAQRPLMTALHRAKNYQDTPHDFWSADFLDQLKPSWIGIVGATFDGSGTEGPWPDEANAAWLRFMHVLQESLDHGLRPDGLANVPDCIITVTS